jgi:membrane protein DedA with SNARE-associated domain
MELSPELITFVTSYGYLAVFFGSLLEGDALILIGSFLAHAGKVNLCLVLICGIVGTWISDTLWFMLGRYSNSKMLENWVWLHQLSNRSVHVVSRRPRLMSLTLRFMYGLRMIIPFSLGKSTLPFHVFTFYNSIGIIIWAFLLSAIGYFFVFITETTFGKMKHLEIILPAIVVATLFTLIYSQYIFSYLFKILRKN